MAWELAYPADTRTVGFGGKVEHYTSSTDGTYKSRWVPSQIVEGVPYDVLQVGYKNGCNKLRLWRLMLKIYLTLVLSIRETILDL